MDREVLMLLRIPPALWLIGLALAVSHLTR